MSCWGSKHTPLFHVQLEKVISFADDERRYPFTTKFELFVRIYRLELSAALSPKKKQHGFVSKYGMVGIPRVGMLDWKFSSWPADQYNGDYTERTEEDRKTGYYKSFYK